MYSLLKVLPRNHLSYLIGRLAHIPLPGFLAGILIRFYCRSYKIDLSEVSEPIDSFHSLGAFFVRDLKDGVRPIGEGFVSPVDGTLREFGPIQEGALPQVKGKSYSVESLLEDSEQASQYEGGDFYSLYLSPSDYHHVHSPVDGTIRFCRYIAGDLWPVNDWSIQAIDNLFPKNERVVVGIETDNGLVAVVLVGATNVGRISMSFERGICSNNLRRVLSFPTPAPVQFDYSPGISISKGARLGTFHLGSSVVVLFPAEVLRNASASNGQSVRYGEMLAEY